MALFSIMIFLLSFAAAAFSLWPMIFPKSVALTADMTNLDKATKPRASTLIGGIFALLACLASGAQLLENWHQHATESAVKASG